MRIPRSSAQRLAPELLGDAVDVWRGATALVLALAWLVGTPLVATAQAPLLDGLGGPLGYGTLALARDDDTVFAEVDVTAAFPTGLLFFGATVTSIFVNNNGNVTLRAPVATFTPTTFAPGAPQPMIAAWWGDVDTRRIPDPDVENLVYYAVEPTRVVVTWFLVDYFNQHGDLRNSFQIVLTPAAGEPAGTLDIELRYNRCEWTTGDASGGRGGFGGQPAAAGVDEGPDLPVDGGVLDAGSALAPGYLTLPGSRTMDVLDLCTTSNVGETGVWRIRPRGEAIVPACGNFFVDRGEECDDGNTSPRDGCDGSCGLEGCGNGRLEGSEACDDGNTSPRDGCDAMCRIEEPDAGPPEVDAGFDAGRDAGPDRVVIGGGGCACRHVRAVHRPRALGAALVALLATLTARARRGVRRRPSGSREPVPS